MSASEVSFYASILAAIGAICLLIRLVWLGLAVRYGWLFGYFLTDAVETLSSLRIPRYENLYSYIYHTAEGLKVVLAIGIAAQLWLLALREYPALARFGRRVMIYLLMAALGLALVGIRVQPPRHRAMSAFFHAFNVFQGALDSMVVLFLLAVTIFLLWFPVEVPKNVAALVGGLVVYLSAQWVALLILNFEPRSNPVVGAVVMSCYCVCLTFWTLALERKGEVVTTVTGHRWNPAQAERLIGQLNAMNAQLAKLR